MLIIPTIEIVMNSENRFRPSVDAYSYDYLCRYVRENGGIEQLLQSYLAAIVFGIINWDHLRFGIENGLEIDELLELFKLTEPAVMPVEA